MGLLGGGDISYKYMLYRELVQIKSQKLYNLYLSWERSVYVRAHKSTVGSLAKLGDLLRELREDAHTHTHTRKGGEPGLKDKMFPVRSPLPPNPKILSFINHSDLPCKRTCHGKGQDENRLTIGFWTTIFFLFLHPGTIWNLQLTGNFEPCLPKIYQKASQIWNQEHPVSIACFLQPM